MNREEYDSVMTDYQYKSFNETIIVKCDEVENTLLNNIVDYGTMILLESPRQTCRTNYICKFLAYKALTDNDFALTVIVRNHTEQILFLTKINYFITESKFTNKIKDEAINKISNIQHVYAFGINDCIVDHMIDTKYLFISNFEYVSNEYIVKILNRYYDNIINGNERHVLMESVVCDDYDETPYLEMIQSSLFNNVVLNTIDCRMSDERVDELKRMLPDDNIVRREILLQRL